MLVTKSALFDCLVLFRDGANFLIVLCVLLFIGDYSFADRSAGRAGGLNPDNSGDSDAKNLRVKVVFLL